MVRPELAAPPGVPVAHPNRASSRPGWEWPVGTAGPLVLALVLWAGHSAINQAVPRTAVAGAWYAVGAASAAALGWTSVRLARARWVWIVGSALAVPVGLWVAYLATGYALATFVTYHYFLYSMGPLWLATVITAGVTHHWSSPSTGRKAVLAGGMALSGGMGLAMLVHLLTIQEQAEKAKAAHDIPGLGLVPVLLAVAVATRLRR